MFKKYHCKFLSMALVLMLTMAALSFANGQEQKTEPAEMFYYVASKVKIEIYDGDNLARTQDLGTEELWVGEKEIADVSGERILYLNTEKNQLILIDLKNRTYVTTQLPVKLENIYSKEKLLKLQKQKRTGVVKPLKKTREIMGLKCKAYQFTTKTTKENGTGEQNVITAWASTKVPFDLKKYDQLLECLRVISNRDKKERRQLEKIKGLQLRIEGFLNQEGKRQKYISEVVEISKKVPPVSSIDELISAQGLTRIERFK
ncbi:MAG: hypothetical protein JSV88_24755 [Candidatus Aminicenantes bacterium]|nr:MAG: hypothetical protein JSV88_24755 [Candidatus Aminicenantes bacterium]